MQSSETNREKPKHNGFVTRDWTVAPSRNLLVRGAEQVHLEPRVMDVLVLLAQRAGEVVSREELVDQVWVLHAPSCRVIDTRNPTGTYGGPALSSGASRRFVLAGRCGIPSSAKAVAVSIAVTQATNGPGFLTLYPGGTTSPVFSSINYSAAAPGPTTP